MLGEGNYYDLVQWQFKGREWLLYWKRTFQKRSQSKLLQDANALKLCIRRLKATITTGTGRYLMKHRKKIKVTTLKTVALSKASTSSMY